MALPAIIGAAGSLAAAGLSAFGANKDRQMQEKFARSGIQWKVEDAEKAGVHPLFALGAQTHSFAPVGVGTAAAHLESAGQDIGRAVAAGQPEGIRMADYTRKLQDLQLTRAGLENELLASQIAKIRQAGTPPAPPTVEQKWLLDGQGSVPSLIDTAAMSRSASDPEKTYMEPGVINEVGFARTSDGGWAPVYSNDAKQRLEEDTLGAIGWNIRNRLGPIFGMGLKPPNVPLEKGKAWIYNPITQQYVQVSERLARILRYQTWEGPHRR